MTSRPATTQPTTENPAPWARLSEVFRHACIVDFPDSWITWAYPLQAQSVGSAGVAKAFVPKWRTSSSTTASDGLRRANEATTRTRTTTPMTPSTSQLVPASDDFRQITVVCDPHQHLYHNTSAAAQCMFHRLLRAASVRHSLALGRPSHASLQATASPTSRVNKHSGGAFHCGSLPLDSRSLRQIALRQIHLQGFPRSLR